MEAIDENENTSLFNYGPKVNYRKIMIYTLAALAGVMLIGVTYAMLTPTNTMPA